MLGHSRLHRDDRHMAGDDDEGEQRRGRRNYRWLAVTVLSTTSFVTTLCPTGSAYKRSRLGSMCGQRAGPTGA